MLNGLSEVLPWRDILNIHEDAAIAELGRELIAYSTSIRSRIFTAVTDEDIPRKLPLRSGIAYRFGSIYFFGLIMMCAPGVPGYISQGALSLGLVDSPVDSGVA